MFRTGIHFIHTTETIPLPLQDYLTKECFSYRQFLLTIYISTQLSIFSWANIKSETLSVIDKTAAECSKLLYASSWCTLLINKTQKSNLLLGFVTGFGIVQMIIQDYYNKYTSNQ